MDRSEELADSILLGEVITLDANSTIAEAVAVAGGRIIAAGSAKDVLGRSDGNTEIHDFGDAARARYMYGRASTIYGGSNEVQKNIIAKAILGL